MSVEAPAWKRRYHAQQERTAALEAQLAEVEEYLPPESPAYQSMGERAKLLKDQMEYAAESSGELGRALAALEAQVRALREALEKIRDGDSDCECNDHTSPECCANIDGSCCPHCVAGAALDTTEKP